MQGPPVTLRCTRCGSIVAAPAPPVPYAAWYRCPTCGQPIPVLRPRDPAPLFTWEAFPHLYPPPPAARPPGARAYRLCAVLLLLATVLVLASAAGLLWQGARADPGPTYTIGGHVLQFLNGNTTRTPISGALVVLTDDSGRRSSTTTGPGGGFSFPRVPTGAIELNVSASGFEPATLDLFASPPYSSAGGNLTNLSVYLAPGSPAAGTTQLDTEFPSLENFLATVWSSASLLVLAGLVGAAGTVYLARRGRAPWGVAAGSAGVLAPVALGELGVTNLFPILTDLTLLAGALGGTAVTILIIALLRTETPEPPE
jgi:hypothetical protein